jgi:Glycosyl hydrolase family 1
MFSTLLLLVSTAYAANATTVAAKVEPKYLPTLYKIPQDVKGSLPKDFLFGYASAATQVEGEANNYGKTDSIWVRDH